MSESILNLTKTDYDNMVQFKTEKIDHVIIVKDSQVYLVIHGSPNGTVVYDGKEVDLYCASELVRKELGLTILDNLNIKVFCCYDGCQKEYISLYTNITCVFHTKDKVYYELTDKHCRFYVH